jgi:Zinc finger, C3HC4 type (RING finger)
MKMVPFEFDELLDTLQERRDNARMRGSALTWISKTADIPKRRRCKPSNEKFHLNDFSGVTQNPLDVHPGPMPRGCVLCRSAPACIAVLGCGDLCLCYACAVKTRNSSNQCPMCNGGILDKNGKLQMQHII